jgi:hypothetical protein
MLEAFDTDVFGFIKPELDAHTLGVMAAAELLKDCGYRVVIGDDPIERAAQTLQLQDNQTIIKEWIAEKNITRIGLSYRLDQQDAVRLFQQLMLLLESNQLMTVQGGPIKLVFFGGLPQGAEAIRMEYQVTEAVETFIGGETAKETLIKMGIPEQRIAKHIKEESHYDTMLRTFGKSVIDDQTYKTEKPIGLMHYAEYGTASDTLLKRMAHRRDISRPLIRAHVGPYDASAHRLDNLHEFVKWVEVLAKSGHLDVLSIGSSQLTQSNFGEDWGERINGGGVPINAPEEYQLIYEASRPLLVRTYAGTKNIPELAKMHEETMNICWHALSFWWFNQLDGRGPYDLYTNLKQHVETLKVIAESEKPFEPNVPHHFAFRGADDVTCIVSAYLTAKLAKKMGIKTFILQSMLNTPRSTWGVQDLAKSRAMLQLVRELEDSHFKVLLQTRAGLDYFKPSLEEAKIQLAAVTALMDDIEPQDESSPQIIHVVSYSEASHLATPDIINESIQITQVALQKYRAMRRAGMIQDMGQSQEVESRMSLLLQSARVLIDGIETAIDNPYSAEGFYKIFAAGFLPAPYLWGDVAEFQHAIHWRTKLLSGGVVIVDGDGKPVDSSTIVAYARQNLKEVANTIKVKQGAIYD